MKILILSILVMSGLLFTNFDAKTACPEGYTEKTVVVYPCSYCAYTVTICYQCNIGPETSVISYKVKRVKPNNPDCTCSLKSIQTAVDNKLVDPNFITSLCGSINVKPCLEQDFITVRVESAICWKKIHDPICVYAEECDDPAKCIRIWKLCWTGTEYIACIVNCWIEGDPVCQDSEPPDPEINEESVCFKMFSPCYDTGDPQYFFNWCDK